MSEMDTFKVKLRRMGWSNNDVDALTRGVSDINELRETKKNR